MDGIMLKIQRIKSGFTQWDLAHLAGVHPARISEMERGRRDVSAEVIGVIKKARRESRELMSACKGGE